MPHLFSPLVLRQLTLRNRIVMSPMCMYSAAGDGKANSWHLAHYVARATGGCGLILAEATAVEPRGRIHQNDLGLWNDSQVEPIARIARSVSAEGGAFGVQLAHAGRKAWSADSGHGPEMAVAPSAVPFSADWATPNQLSAGEIDLVVQSWRAAAARADAAGCDLIEIHAAHGYLLHQFLSPLSNHRSDAYGGSPQNRRRVLLHVVEAVQEVWPRHKPVLVRVSATDWQQGGLAIDDIISVARQLSARGVDLIDCSTGGAVPSSLPGTGPGYQVPYAEKVRVEVGIPTAAVGLITAPEQADQIIRNGRADLVALGRELLRNPYWPLEAARQLGHDMIWPRQYRRARLD